MTCCPEQQRHLIGMTLPHNIHHSASPPPTAKPSGSQPGGSRFASWSPRPWQRGTTLVHRHNARLPGSGQSAVGGTGAGLSDHRATCVTAESWCGRAAGIDGPTWVMATYKIADCTRYIPYPKTATASHTLLLPPLFRWWRAPQAAGWLIWLLAPRCWCSRTAASQHSGSMQPTTSQNRSDTMMLCSSLSPSCAGVAVPARPKHE